MYKKILQRISEDIDWMALTPLLLFFIVFAGVIIVVFAQRKGHFDYMARLPLEEDASMNEPQS